MDLLASTNAEARILAVQAVQVHLENDMNRDIDIALAERYRREAEEDEQRAREAEQSLSGYTKENQQLCRDYVVARTDAARFARKLADLHRERAQQD